MVSPQAVILNAMTAPPDPGTLEHLLPTLPLPTQPHVRDLAFEQVTAWMLTRHPDYAGRYESVWLWDQ